MALENTKFTEREVGELLQVAKRLFFLGIGGVSMSALAEYTLSEGIAVSGSDHVPNARTKRLSEKGVTFFSTHAPKNPDGCDALIYTLAVGEDTPELTEARRKKLPIISRADYLAWILSRYENRIGIAGMNGKSTTTAMASHLLSFDGDPTVFCGADLIGWENGFRHGKLKEEAIFESCEYRDSFLDFSPNLAVILNVGWDHVDYFQSLDAVKRSFLQFAEKTVPGGKVLYNADDPATVETLRDFGGEKIGFSVNNSAYFTAKNLLENGGFWSFDFFVAGEYKGRVKLSVPGAFNVENALAAVSIAVLRGRDPETAAKEMESFKGVRRRMEYKGNFWGAKVYEDYAHHPSAIREALATAKRMAGEKRVVCCYQPHTYSRTKGLFREFCGAFDDADRVIFAPIYAAREKNESGISSRDLAKEIGEKADFVSSLEELVVKLKGEISENDLLIVMGAGDIDRIFSKINIEK